MNVTLGSILFPERRKITVDSRKGLHSKRKKQVNAQKSQEQTSKQFTTRLLLDDESISPNDFLTPFPSDDVRNTEQFWEYLERVFYPVDERWVSVLDLSARPQNIEPNEACIGLHFAYRWALADLFDTDELFKLVEGGGKMFKGAMERRRGSLCEDGGEQGHQSLDSSGSLDADDQLILSYLECLDLPTLELIGFDPAVGGGIITKTNTNTSTSTGTGEGDEVLGRSVDRSSRSRGTVNNPYFEEWKFLYQRLRYVEREADSMLLKLTNSLSENIHKDNSRRLLQRHQKKKCKEFLLKVMHYHSMRQFVDSLEEVLYFDEKTGLYLTTWDDGEAVRAAWMTQDQLLQLLLFRPNSTESKYSVSIPSEYIPYAKSLDTYWLRYLLDSGLTMISDSSSNSQDDDRLGDTLNLDSPTKPKEGCIELSRHPLCHYCRRSCKRLSYSRCPSKIKPLNLGINQTGQTQNTSTPGYLLNSANSAKLPGTSASTSSSNIYYSRSLIPWRVPRSHKNMENSDHSEAKYINNSQHGGGSCSNQTSFGGKIGKPAGSCSRSSVGGLSCGTGASCFLGVNGSHVCNICTDFESSLDGDDASIPQEEILVSRAYSPNNCWRMYCSECIMHNFSSIIKQKYSNGVVLRYYCPFCNGACNCERCLRNQQIRKIKNYLKSRFCGYIFQCSISSCVVQSELSWYDFLKDYGGDSLLLPENSVLKESSTTEAETTLMNDLGEIDESLVNRKNLAVVSYINNANRRFSVAENTHLGLIWLQSNNIPFQKPPSSSSGVNPGLRDSGSKNNAALSSTHVGKNMSDSNKLVSKSKSRNRSSINGTQKNKRHSNAQVSVGSDDLGNPSDVKHPQITQNIHSNQPTNHNTKSSHSGSGSTGRNGAQHFPPSIHIPREVINEPTHASGASVLWSLRSILINNVNKYHRECLNNLERWESVRELYNRKRVELEGYFKELLSKLNLMDEWIRSISFTETNKRFITRKMPLLCWATDIPSAKSFNFDDYPQLTPDKNVVEMVKHIQNFVKNGIISEDLPTHQILGISEIRDEGMMTGVSQKTTPNLKLIDKLPGMMATSTPSSVMEFLMSSIPEIQNIVVKTNSSSTKDESGRTSKVQRSSKKDKSGSKGSVQSNKLSPLDSDGLNPDEAVKVLPCTEDLTPERCAVPSSMEEASVNQANSNSSINAEFLPRNHDVPETVSSYDPKHHHPQTCIKPIGGKILEQGGHAYHPNPFLLEDVNSPPLPSSILCINGSDSSMIPDEGNGNIFQPCSGKSIPRQEDPGTLVEYLQQKSRKRKLSPDLAPGEILTPEKKEQALKRKRDKETVRKTIKKNSGLSPAGPEFSNSIGDSGDVLSLSGDGTAFSMSSNPSGYNSPRL